ncbi:MAG TPA: arginase [Longimicrobiaceae bacterium]|nr:arginase [Longimicrobiaceae bacterium]
MKLEIIGAPIDFGAGRRGVEMGPAAIRLAGLNDKLDALGHEAHDAGNVAVPLRDRALVGDPRIRYLDLILSVQEQIAEAVSGAISRGRFPIVLGGDHSVGLGSIAAVARDRQIGVVWIDTHGDFNTHETTLSGNVHGMPLAALGGYGHPQLVSVGGWRGAEPAVDPRNIVIVGARDLDAGERDLLREAGVTVYSMSVIDRYGIRRVMESAIEIAGRGTEGLYASVDLDVMDPTIAPGVGTPVPGGLTVREGHLIMELLAQSGRMLGLDVVEVNPILDERNRTAGLAVDLILSAVGKRVWSTEDVPALEG